MAGEIRVRSTIAPTQIPTTTGAAIILATTEQAKQNVLTVIEIIALHPFRILIRINTSPPALVVTRVISKEKGITLAGITALFHKIGIAALPDVTVLAIVTLIKVKSNYNFII
jgi:hypothetical protein